MKLIPRILLTTLLIFYFSVISFSQIVLLKDLIVYPFGVKDSAIHQVTHNQILSNPTLICNKPNCVVTKFSISFLPKGKGQEYLGPFAIHNSSKIEGRSLNILKGLMESNVAVTRIYIDSIHVDYNGKDIKYVPIFMRCTL